MMFGANRYRHGGAAAILALLVLGTAACSAVRAADSDTATDTIEAMAGAIRTGCQGGVTGGGNGVRIDADDHVIVWSKATFNAPVDETDSGPDSVLAAEIRQQLDAFGFTSIAFDEPGNVTCFVTYREHTVAWPMGDSDAPEGVVAVHARLSAAD